MAARIRAAQNELTREKIRTTQLVKRLVKHALSDEEIMTTSQIRAAEILLKKTMPDLSAVEIEAQVEHHEVKANPLSESEWEQTYGDSVGTTAGASTLVN